MPWLILALTSAFLFSGVGIFQKVFPSKARNTRAFSIWFLVFATLLSFILWLKEGALLKITLSPTLLLALIFYGVWDRWRFEISKIIDASVMILLSVMVVVIPVLGGILFLGEKLSFQNILGILFVLVAVSLLAWNSKSGLSFDLKKFSIALLLNIFLGLAVLTDKINLRVYPLYFYNLLVWSLPILFLIPPKLNLGDLKTELKESGKLAGLLALIQTTAYTLALIAMRQAPVSKVAPVTNLSLILGTLLSLIIFKEREGKNIKILASLLAFLGVYLVST